MWNVPNIRWSPPHQLFNWRLKIRTLEPMVIFILIVVFKKSCLCVLHSPKFSLYLFQSITAKNVKAFITYLNHVESTHKFSLNGGKFPKTSGIVFCLSTILVLVERGCYHSLYSDIHYETNFTHEELMYLYTSFRNQISTM